MCVCGARREIVDFSDYRLLNYSLEDSYYLQVVNKRSHSNNEVMIQIGYVSEIVTIGLQYGLVFGF